MSHPHGSPAHHHAHPHLASQHAEPHPGPHLPHGHVHLSHHEEVMARLRHEHDAKIKATIRNGLLSIGGFVVLLGGGAVFWLRELERQHAEMQAVETARNELRAELLPAGELTPERARTVLARIEATQAQWQGTPDAAAILRQAEAVRAVLSDAAAAHRLDAEMSAVQHELDTRQPSLADWRRLHERISALDAGADTANKARLDALVDRVDAGWFDALLGAAAAAGASPATALGHLTTAVDLGACHLEATKGERAREQAWRQRLQTLTPRFDAAQKATFDAAAIAAVPFEPLLPGTGDADWIASRGTGLGRQFTGDTLKVDNAGGEHSQILALRQRSWYGAQLAFTVQLECGEVVVFGRSRQQFDPRHGGGLCLSTAAKDGAVVVPKGQPVAIELTIVGDRLQARVGDRQVEQAIRHDERRGGLGLLVRPDTSFRLQGLRVRRLGGSSESGHAGHGH